MTARYRRLFELRLGGRARVHEEMDAELEAHIAMRTADLVREGMDPDEARREALRRFGDFADARRRLYFGAREREASLRNRDRVASFIGDLRYGFRQARRAPGFTMLAVASLAIGIGATTAMFTLVDRVLLRPLPFPHSEELVALAGMDSARNTIPEISAADWLDWRNARSLQASALIGFPYRQAIVLADSATRVSAEQVTGDFFSVMGTRFAAGRPFTRAELEQAGSPNEVVISERLWRSLFHSDPGLAAPLHTALRTYTVVGVVANGQEYPAGTDVWFAHTVARADDPTRVDINWNAVARLRPGVTAAQASAELATMAHGIYASDPSALYDYSASARPLAATVVGDEGGYLMMLLGVVGLVLLIVCANIAASSLARASARGREMAVRAALGASRVRLLQQIILEHMGLGLLGGVLGIGVAFVALKGVLAWWGDAIPRAAEVRIDTPVIFFAIVVTLAAGLIAGFLPAIGTSRASLRGLLAAGGRTAARGGGNLLGASLVAGEIALATVLLISAMLLIRSFRAVIGTNLGFDTHVATAQVTLSGPTYSADTARRYAYWSRVVDAYAGIPGVQSVGLAQWIPLDFTGQGFVDVEGRESDNSGAVYRVVSAGYFNTLEIPVLRGRVFGAADVRDGLRTVVINRRMAETFWPGADPIGRRVRARSMEAGKNGQPADWLTVVGVVGDGLSYGPENDARSEMFVDYRQAPLVWTSSMNVLVRGSSQPAALLHEMARRAHEIDAHVPVDLSTMDQRLQNTLEPRTLTMSLLTGFSLIAILLAALGTYGVLAYAVTQRSREMAIRTALGARRGQIMGLVFGSGFRLVATGMVVGIGASFWLTRLLRAMLVGVSTLDPISFGLAIGVLLLVSLAAMLVPAARATRYDPVMALQAD